MAVDAVLLAGDEGFFGGRAKSRSGFFKSVIFNPPKPYGP